MDRPPLVLLHGGGPGVDAASNWASVQPRLSSRFRCLAPDLLGFGTRIAGTGGIEGPQAWALARARQILALLDSHGLDRVHVLGNSAAGGAAALALLSVAPERVGRAIVMGGAGTGPLPPAVPFYDHPTKQSMRATLGRLVADESEHGALLDELAEVRLRQALRPGAEAAFRSMFAEGPLRVDPATITNPVLVLHGQRDRVSRVGVSERLAATLPHARLEVVAGAGHWIHVDRPDRFRGLVEEFLNA
ncbi:alpha/beta fold hydrolase [Amycolatopsis acidicola]|uniref:Alpha/beta fold hydrolase n=1 Tax=Amycolatopsis acidicola TaxID=2596893 RepID=A0A5N0UXJ4_9PSEU|nr:alpha/beta hydrolase [Amycolatopsis acidicola]KAA9156023.1 alpha/beta fold hydrolase [Amycolatopsis acidicola]